MDPVARSSSPVSGCFLKRLEIMDKATAHSYEAAPGSILTLSLESYAAGLSQSSSLMLHLHRNGRSMLQVNMSNILKTHQDNGIIQIVESLQQLRVTIPSTGEVTAHFVERRDFSMATCILEKAGFLIHEVLRVMQHKPSTSFQQSATDFGPRLSDIRPPGSRQRIPHSSSLAMQQLGEESAPDSLLETQTTPESTWDYSTPSQSASLVSHLDPYVHFLGKQANMHQPQVSSPLRNSFEAEPSLVPDMPVETPPSSYPEEATPREESFGSATSRPVRVLTQKSGRTRPPSSNPIRLQESPPVRTPTHLKGLTSFEA
ncbi:hypothetical protein B0I35DRAFT_52605 [Stachybotrys elegans]|uniref:Uncharacterized protein n=1 Tax=Stachybotrys elegans TaxID=80388 RepID=A0A8K0SMB2_9HYPO|nr:hypothetical protein B0I35DRAFT_52605 [Stachybotrys elegans]